MAYVSPQVLVRLSSVRKRGIYSGHVFYFIHVAAVDFEIRCHEGGRRKKKEAKKAGRGDLM